MKALYTQLNVANAWPYLLQIAGLQAPEEQPDQGNTAALLTVSEESGTTRGGVLLDAGLGTSRALASRFPGCAAWLDTVLVTHWHPDHTAELFLTAEMLWRARTDLRAQAEPRPVTIVFPAGAEAALRARHNLDFAEARGWVRLVPWAPGDGLGVDLAKHPTGRRCAASSLVLPELGVDVRAVDAAPHAAIAGADGPTALNYVMEAPGPLRVLVGWDIPGDGAETLVAALRGERLDLAVLDANTTEVACHHATVAELLPATRELDAGAVWLVHFNHDTNVLQNGAYRPRPNLAALGFPPHVRWADPGDTHP